MSAANLPNLAYGLQSAGQLWMRKWSLTIGDQSGQNALDLSKLGFNFEVDKTGIMTPWRGRITIYNPSEAIVSGLQKQYTNVQLTAGYMPPSQQYGIIFQAPIAWYRYGRLNATDTFVELHGITGDQWSTQAVVNVTLPAKHKQIDVVNACIKAMGPFGVALGYITDLGDTQAPRGRVVYGMARDILRDVSRTAGANYHVDDNLKLHILKESESFKTEQVPVLNSKSGMIDVPHMTSDGSVEVQCLLNYAIQPGNRIQINEKDIVRAQSNPANANSLGLLFEDSKMLNQQKIAFHADGFYRVGKVRHTGENRGQTWFTALTTMSEASPTGGISAPKPVTSA